MFGPRGLLDCKATDVDDPTVDPRFGKAGNASGLTTVRPPSVDSTRRSMKRRRKAGQLPTWRTTGGSSSHSRRG